MKKSHDACNPITLLIPLRALADAQSCLGAWNDYSKSVDEMKALLLCYLKFFPGRFPRGTKAHIFTTMSHGVVNQGDLLQVRNYLDQAYDDFQLEKLYTASACVAMQRAYLGQREGKVTVDANQAQLQALLALIHTHFSRKLPLFQQLLRGKIGMILFGPYEQAFKTLKWFAHAITTCSDSTTHETAKRLQIILHEEIAFLETCHQKHLMHVKAKQKGKASEYEVSGSSNTSNGTQTRDQISHQALIQARQPRRSQAEVSQKGKATDEQRAEFH